MAKSNKKEKPNVNKINRVNRRLSSNINNLLDGLQSTVLGNPKRSEIESLNHEFNELLKTDINSLNDKMDGDVTSFLTKLVSNNQKVKATSAIDTIEEMFDMKEGQIEAFLSEAYKNNLLKQGDIHEVSTQLNELREAILVTRDSITSSDVVDGHMSRILSFKNAASIENCEEYIPIIEQMEKTFKIQEKIKNFIVPKTLEYGSYYGYIIPYSKIFEDFNKAKEKNAGHINFTESTLYDIADTDKLGKIFLENASDEIKSEYSKNNKSGSKKQPKELTTILKNISISNDDMPLSFLTEGSNSIEHLMALKEKEKSDRMVVEARRKSSNKFSEIHRLDSGIISDKKSSRDKQGEFAEIGDCQVKFVDGMHLIPVQLMDYTIGYYYIHETDIGSVSGSLTSPVSYNIYQGKQGKHSIIDVISDEIVKSFDKKFLEDNIKFKQLIANAISYFNINEKKIKFQYIPKEYIVEFKINEDENGQGTSIIEPALFYAKLYLMMLMFKMTSIVSYSNDTRVHYIRQSGIDKNIINKVQEIARNMQNRQVNMLDMFSYTSLVNKVANGSDRFIPVGKTGERGIETEVIGGQDIPLNTELMEMLKSAYISATGVPSVIMNYINEADYAKTLELANTRYQGRVVSNQFDFNSSITEFYKKIMKYSTNIPDEVIDLFIFAFATPKYSNGNITSELIGSFSSYSEFTVSLLFTDDEINQPENMETIRLFKLKLAREKLPAMGIERCLELKKEAQIEGIETALKGNALSQTEDVPPDEGADSSTDDYSDGADDTEATDYSDGADETSGEEETPTVDTSGTEEQEETADDIATDYTDGAE